jgi:hypothetical protein
MREPTRASLRSWLSQPEWGALLAFLNEAEGDALQSLVAADPSDVAAIARAQSEIKLLRLFTSGEIAEALKAHVT